MSAKGAERRARIAEAGEEAKRRDGYRCRGLGLIPGHSRCWGPLDPQHVIPRGVRPDLADDPRVIVALCRGAHEWVGDHPAEARVLGLHAHDGDPITRLDPEEPHPCT